MFCTDFSIPIQRFATITDAEWKTQVLKDRRVKKMRPLHQQQLVVLLSKSGPSTPAFARRAIAPGIP